MRDIDEFGAAPDEAVFGDGTDRDFEGGHVCFGFCMDVRMAAERRREETGSDGVPYGLISRVTRVLATRGGVGVAILEYRVRARVMSVVLFS